MNKSQHYIFSKIVWIAFVIYSNLKIRHFGIALGLSVIGIIEFYLYLGGSKYYKKGDTYGI